MIHVPPGGRAIGAIGSSGAIPELRLASAVDSAGECMLVLDGEGRVLFFNKACARVFGRSSAQVVGEHVKLLMPRQAAESLGHDVAGYFSQAEARGNVCFEDSDGHDLRVELSFSTASTAAGTQHLLVLRRRPAPGQPHEANSDVMRAARIAAMEDVSAAIIHKLNQPLTALTLYLQTIERVYSRETSGAVLPDRVASILEKSVHEAERAGNMLQDLRRSLEQGDGAVVVETNGVAEHGEAPDEGPEPLDDQREPGGDLAVSRAIAQDCGGDLVMDSGERERFTPRPALPARVAAPPAQEEQRKWANV